MRKRRPSGPTIQLKSEEQIDIMRRSGKITALALEKINKAIRPGITTAELDVIAENAVRAMGAIPAFLGYNSYPATACISVNDEVVHGIPGGRVVREGDLVSVDMGAILEGWYSDSAWTFAVGPTTDAQRALMQAGIDGLAAGIAAAVPGNRLRDIANAVQQVAESRGYSVVRDLCGHGIGRRMHEDPQVPNYVGAVGENLILRAGMTLAIEPMINAGRPEVTPQADGWLFTTNDGSLSVHFEHTVVIRADGAEILTRLR